MGLRPSEEQSGEEKTALPIQNRVADSISAGNPKTTKDPCRGLPLLGEENLVRKQIRPLRLIPRPITSCLPLRNEMLSS